MSKLVIKHYLYTHPLLLLRDGAISMCSNDSKFDYKITFVIPKIIKFNKIKFINLLSNFKLI